MRAEHRDDAVVALLERDQVRAEPVLSAVLDCPLAKDRLQPHLREEQPVGGAQAFDALVVRAIEVRQLLAAQALDGDDRSALLELARGRFRHLSPHSDGAEDLHRPLMERGSAG